MKRKRGDRGIALLLAMLVLTILMLLITQMALTTSHNKSIAQNANGELQNDYGARAGYHQAMLRIQYDTEKSKDVDHLLEKWATGINVAVGEASVRVNIMDSERKFNLTALLTDKGEAIPEAVDQLMRLIQILGHEPGDPARRIVDYIDSDTKGDFEAGARNEPMINLDELQRIEGLRKEVLIGDEGRKGLLPYLTLWPKTTPPSKLQVNPNTASAEVLQSLHPDMDMELARGIVSYRSGNPGIDGGKHFAKSDDLLNVSGMKQELLTAIAGSLVFKSTFMEVHVVSTVGTVERKQLYVVSRTFDPVPKYTLVTALRENDFLTLPAPEEETK